MSRVNKPPISVSKLSKFMEKNVGKVAVIVGTVTDDIRVTEFPALKVKSSIL